MHSQLRSHCKVFFFLNSLFHYGSCALLQRHCGSSTRTQHYYFYLFIYLLIFLLCLCFHVLDQQTTVEGCIFLFISCFFVRCCWRLLSVLKPRHIFKRAPWVSFWSRALQQWCLCSLHSGRPPWAVGRWQISDGWQIRGTTLPICAAGLLRLTAFRVSVTELNRW